MDNAVMQNLAREQQLEQWIVRYGNTILHTCIIYLTDIGQAEDAMQDVFLKAWRCMHQFEGRNGCSEKTWLMQITINICHDYHRSKWFKHVDTAKALYDVQTHVDVVSSEDRDLLNDIFTLPIKYKQVILLYYYQEMTLKEIAEVLNISRSTIHHRLQKAQEMLKRKLIGRNLDGE